MDLSIEELKRMQYMNIMDLKREELAEADKIIIDAGEPMEDRIKSFMEQTGNPFAQNVGQYILQIGFVEDAETSIDECMALFARRKIQIMV